MVTITLTTAGAATSSTFDVYWSTSPLGPWTFIANVAKATLLAGYTFVPDATATDFQVRDVGSCATVLTLSCPTTTSTSTTDPLATTTTTTTDPLATTTTTTTIYDNPMIEPDHVLSVIGGGSYYVNLIFSDMTTALSSVDVPDVPPSWFTSTINPTVYIYSVSPLLYYNVMTIVFDSNAGNPERLGQVDILEDGVTPWGTVYVRQEGV